MNLLSKVIPRRTVACALSLGLAVLATGTPAAAHYGIPHAFSLLFQPGATPQRIVLRSDVWGLMYTNDGGSSWSWSCSEAFGGNSSQAQHVPMVVTKSGRVLASLFFKGLSSSDDMCNWTTNADLNGLYVKDVTRVGDNYLVLNSSNSLGDAGFQNAVYQSTDDGTHWTTLGAPLPHDIAADAVAGSPSDPTRLYVTSVVPGTTANYKFERSVDGGKTWLRSDLPVDANKIANFSLTARIPLVHPSNPDILFVWVDLEELFAQNSPDNILASTDGGKTWKDIYESTGDLPGLALSPDGKTLAIAGPFDGVQTADLTDALTNGQKAFKQANNGQVWGLHWSDKGLYAGNNDFTARDMKTGIVPPAYSLGLSTDQGKTFEPLMNLCQVGYGSCAKGSNMDSACKNLWNTPDLANGAGFYYDFDIQDGRCTVDAGATAPVVTPAPKKSSGCAYTRTPVNGKTGASTALVLAALGIVAMRRRARG